MFVCNFFGKAVLSHLIQRWKWIINKEPFSEERFFEEPFSEEIPRFFVFSLARNICLNRLWEPLSAGEMATLLYDTVLRYSSMMKITNMISTLSRVFPMADPTWFPLVRKFGAEKLRFLEIDLRNLLSNGLQLNENLLNTELKDSFEISFFLFESVHLVCEIKITIFKIWSLFNQFWLLFGSGDWKVTMIPIYPTFSEQTEK